jgi:hypothetical protein
MVSVLASSSSSSLHAQAKHYAAVPSVSTPYNLLMNQHLLINRFHG